jgi:hypothetical protein
MKKKLSNLGILATIALLASFIGVMAADSVDPASATFTSVRSEAAATVSAGTIYRGASLNLTNCVCYTTNSTTIQGLDGVTVMVSVGNINTNIDYTATVQSAALGTWHCTVAIPDLSSFTLQVKITDALTNSYIYPPKVMTADVSMF